MLVARNDEKSSNGAVFRRVLLATMKAQQAVAIRFVGRRVTTSTCLFFCAGRGPSGKAHRSVIARWLCTHRIR
jgi:hypothetical protein